MRLTWSLPTDLVPHAFAQADVEGVDVADLRERWRAAGGRIEAGTAGTAGRTDAKTERLAGDLLDEIDARTGERAVAAPQRVDTTTPTDGERRLDRLRGAWWGRAIGCTLGKPVESLPREGIRAIAQATDNWPVAQYFTAVGLPADVAERWPWNRRSAPTSLAETIEAIPEDDDLNYALLALRLLEDHGEALSTDDVATAWLMDLPAGRVFTAERAVYRNLLLGIEPDVAAVHRNPFRDWIGALIRTDVYGWTHAGDANAAVRLADIDALLSHRGAGVDGARFAAALAAEAMVATDVHDVLARARAVLPAGAVADAVDLGVQLGRGEPESEKALDVLHERYGDLHWVHTVNNAALIAYALTAGDGDFTRSIGLVVTGGWDTDSDGATVGGVCGALLGAEALPSHWTAPVGTRFTTSLPGFDGITVNELAFRTAAVAGHGTTGSAGAVRSSEAERPPGEWL